MSSPVSVFVLHWNRPDECAETVRSFLAQTEVELKIVVLDNASSAENLAELRRSLPAGIEVSVLRENLGWGGAFNTVLKPWVAAKSGSEFCVLSAHDARLSPDCIAQLVRAAERDSRLGLICPRYDNLLVTYFSKLRGIGLRDGNPENGVELMPAPHGTLMFLRREALAEFGWFDERYFAYGDEYDLGLRAGRAGWKVAIIWPATVINPGTWTPSALARYLIDRNSLLIVRDHAGALAAWSRAALMLLNGAREALQQLREPTTRGRRLLMARGYAVSDFFSQRLGKPSRPELLKSSD